MTKRLQRIFQDNIHLQLNEIPSQPVNIILRNGKVYLCRIIELNETSLKVKDLRSFKHEFHIKDIEEIIIDI